MRFPQGNDPKAARVFHRKALDVFRQRAALDPADFANKHLLGMTFYYDATCTCTRETKTGRPRVMAKA